METIGVRQLQQHASACVRRVERGERLVVTSRGRPVARLIPYEEPELEGWDLLVANGDIIFAEDPDAPLPEPYEWKGPKSFSEVLQEDREDRI